MWKWKWFNDVKEIIANNEKMTLLDHVYILLKKFDSLTSDLEKFNKWYNLVQKRILILEESKWSLDYKAYYVENKKKLEWFKMRKEQLWMLIKGKWFELISIKKSLQNYQEELFIDERELWKRQQELLYKELKGLWNLERGGIERNINSFELNGIKKRIQQNKDQIDEVSVLLKRIEEIEWIYFKKQEK